ncbi:MAG: protein kinase, partial [Candidatus Aminicenantes bacterium]|nr:protein kinase [Candidatus Aminicenantes bacterium]
MKCPKCAFPNDGGNRTCSQCGEPLDATPLVRDITPIAAYPAGLVLGPGENFGNRYQIIEEIGVGGMGRVFKALDKELQIVVVLKIIKPEMNDSAEAVERFKRELLLAREIIHENVIRIYDLGEMNGTRYISMNYVEGQNLQDLIAMAGPLEKGKVLDVIGKICRALIAAHGKGIIHRDLKPQNVMIGKNGMVTVLDFGIARSMSQVGTTRTGIVIGTPECMAPEQIQGEKIDASTDIYSLGVMMFQMLTGRMPFVADSMQSLLLKHLHETPIPPSSINPAIPRALERIILKCLKKRPDKRYASAEKLLAKIEGLLEKKARREKFKRLLLPLRRPLRLRPVVYLGRLLELALLLFACATVLGWIVDSHFNGKLLGLTAEYPLYFKTRFPMDKDYLPADWPARQGNAWKKYRQAMHVQATLPSGAARRLGRDIEKLRHAAIPPAGVEAVAGVLASAGEKMGMDDVLSGIASNTLAPQAGEPLPAAFIAFFSRWQALKARLEFLRGNTAGGVERLRELGCFLVDCDAAAGTRADHAQA